MIAEYERAKIAERNRRGKLWRASAGEVITWKAPFGYRRVARVGDIAAHLEIYEPEAAVMRHIFDDRVSGGHSIREIARRLNADRIVSPSGNRRVVHLEYLRPVAQRGVRRALYYNQTEATPDPRPVANPPAAPTQGGMDRHPRPAIVSDKVFESAERVGGRNAYFSPRRALPACSCCEDWFAAVTVAPAWPAISGPRPPANPTASGTAITTAATTTPSAPAARIAAAQSGPSAPMPSTVSSTNRSAKRYSAPRFFSPGNTPSPPAPCPR